MNIWSNVFRHHRWSNQVMIDFLSTLTDEQLNRTVPGTYGSSIDTIRHLIASDADYVRIVPDTPDVPQLEHGGPFGGWEQLRTVAEGADTALISSIARNTCSKVRRSTSPSRYRSLVSGLPSTLSSTITINSND